ncbi:hypothetical protein [Bacillus cereus group sp. BfR-BA-01524]|uniref:hypothetical protein n=1 Tax=Bacillus cereus group sp. BfR-BA-01524 TaxID=2920372 RepID=UPI001F563311
MDKELMQDASKELELRIRSGVVKCESINELVLNQLHRMEDKGEAHMLGIQLYGTKWEDVSG